MKILKNATSLTVLAVFAYSRKQLSNIWKKDSNNTVLDVLLLKQKVFDFNQEFSFDRVWYKWTGLGLEIVKEEYWKVSHLCSETCTLGPYYLLKTRNETVLLCCLDHKCKNMKYNHFNFSNILVKIQCCLRFLDIAIFVCNTFCQ